jgi:acetyl-CoA acetyltransferase
MTSGTGSRRSGAPLAAIVGVAESDLGTTQKSILELQTQAVHRALADAGLSIADVDGLFTNGAARFSATQVAEYMGIRPHWTDSTMAGGSSYEIFIAHAAEAIRSTIASKQATRWCSGYSLARRAV